MTDNILHINSLILPIHINDISKYINFKYFMWQNILFHIKKNTPHSIEEVKYNPIYTLLTREYKRKKNISNFVESNTFIFSSQDLITMAFAAPLGSMPITMADSVPLHKFNYQCFDKQIRSEQNQKVFEIFENKFQHNQPLK